MKKIRSSDAQNNITCYVAERVKQLTAKGCRVTFTENNVKVIEKRSNDAYDVNLAMMNAYLDDGVDFFLLLLPRTPHDLQMTAAGSRSNTSCHLVFCDHGLWC